VWARGERFVPMFGRYDVVDNWNYFRLHRPVSGRIGCAPTERSFWSEIATVASWT
jgi:hypothetical protein